MTFCDNLIFTIYWGHMWPAVTDGPNLLLPDNGLFRGSGWLWQVSAGPAVDLVTDAWSALNECPHQNVKDTPLRHGRIHIFLSGEVIYVLLKSNAISLCSSQDLGTWKPGCQSVSLCWLLRCFIQNFWTPIPKMDPDWISENLLVSRFIIVVVLEVFISKLWTRKLGMKMMSLHEHTQCWGLC